MSIQNHPVPSPPPQPPESEPGVQANGGFGPGGTTTSGGKPRSALTPIAIACSFLFSIGLMGWAFTLPMRSGAFNTIKPDTSTLEARMTGLDDGARRKLEHLVEARRRDQALMSQVRAQRSARSGQPTPDAVRQRWNHRKIELRQQLQAMYRDNGNREFEPGTAQWQTLKEYEQVVRDGPGAESSGGESSGGE